MLRVNKTVIRILWGLLPVLFPAAHVGGQETRAPALHMTTQERLETETWWPTMATAPLKAYTGTATCLGCHAEHGSTPPTGMQRAATRGGDVQLMPGMVAAPLVSGSLTYSLAASKDGVQLAVSKGHRKAVQQIDWVMGAGDLAWTFVYRAGERWYQSEASYYKGAPGMDITTGFPPSNHPSLEENLGNLLTPSETRACFGCHTVHATSSAGLDPLHAEAGIGCEACHGPGQQHVSKMQGQDVEGDDLAIFQPAKLSPGESIDFCGACHRSFADASLTTGPHADRVVVRFQPYRLEESKCWRATQDERLRCVACHDPHRPLVREASSYDKNCLNCHSGPKQSAAGQQTAAVCPKATHECTSCHMPKVNLPTVHGDFTDHYIRIAKAGDTLPR